MKAAAVYFEARRRRHEESGSEPQYDGDSMTRQGIVSLTVNYYYVTQFMRLDVDADAKPDKTRERYPILDRLYRIGRALRQFDPAVGAVRHQGAGADT